MNKNMLISDVIASLFFSVLSILFLFNMENLIYEGLPSVVSPALFPTFIGTVVAVLSTIFFIYSTVHLSRVIKFGEIEIKSTDAIFIMQQINIDEMFSIKRCTIYIIILFVYSQLFFTLGFIVSTPIIMCAIAYLLGGKRFWIMLPSFILLSFVIEYVSFNLIRIALPTLDILPAWK